MYVLEQLVICRASAVATLSLLAAKETEEGYCLLGS
jgi:hypothetical protein